MSGRIGGRLGAVLVIGSIWLGAIAAPASAAQTFRYVDDNVGATACHHTSFHSIQAAINASSPKDVVYVCPGTYHEEVLVDVPGLTVQSLSYRRAKIVPDGTDGLGAAVVLAADGAKLRGFKILIPAGEVVTPLAGGLPSCSGLEAAVVAAGQRQGVWGNYIDATGDNTLSGDCGYAIGILFQGTETLNGFSGLGPDKSSAKRNYIRDFKLAGILAEGPDVAVRISNNQIRYVHQDDPATCVPVNSFQIVAQLTLPCEPVNATPNPLNGIFGFSVGIGVGDGALADVAFNTVFSTFDFALIEGGDAAMPLIGGIIGYGMAAGSRITENVVTQTFLGIGLDPSEFPIFPGFAQAQPDPAPNGVEVTLNRATEGYVGLVIDSQRELCLRQSSADQFPRTRHFRW